MCLELPRRRHRTKISRRRRLPCAARLPVLGPSLGVGQRQRNKRAGAAQDHRDLEVCALSICSSDRVLAALKAHLQMAMSGPFTPKMGSFLGFATFGMVLS